MRSSAAVVALFVVASCHLADDIDAPRCEPGFHPELQRCVPDETSEKRVKISAPPGGVSCGGDPASERAPVLEPETLGVKVGELFQFENTDTVEHEIRGADGTVWSKVPPGALSDLTSIGRPGSWAYRVSGCEQGGTVIVE